MCKNRWGLFISALGIVFVVGSLQAAPIQTNPAPIADGLNVFAGAAVNDSAGSSDLTLDVELTADGEILIQKESPCRVIVPTENIPGDDEPMGWTFPEFDDSDWQEAAYSIGYGDGDDTTVIGDGSHAMVYSRAIFDLRDASGVRTLTLGVNWDDGFVIWINGVEVARESGTDIPEDAVEWDSWTDKGSGHSHEATGTYATIDLDTEVIGSPFAVEPAGKLVATWAAIKAIY